MRTLTERTLDQSPSSPFRIPAGQHRSGLTTPASPPARFRSPGPPGRFLPSNPMRSLPPGHLPPGVQRPTDTAEGTPQGQRAEQRKTAPYPQTQTGEAAEAVYDKAGNAAPELQRTLPTGAWDPRRRPLDAEEWGGKTASDRKSSVMAQTHAADITPRQTQGRESRSPFLGPL